MFRTRNSSIHVAKVASLTIVLTLLVALSIGGTRSTAQAQTLDENLAGGLGGTVAGFQAEWGAPSWTDTGLISYDSLAVNGVNTIVVVWYEADETVYEIDLVYLEQPAELSITSAAADGTGGTVHEPCAAHLIVDSASCLAHITVAAGGSLPCPNLPGGIDLLHAVGHEVR